MNNKQKLIDAALEAMVAADCDVEEIHEMWRVITIALEGKVIIDAEPTHEMYKAWCSGDSIMNYADGENIKDVAYKIWCNCYKAMLNSTEGLSDE